jgi:hypothetical protein
MREYCNGYLRSKLGVHGLDWTDLAQDRAK